MVLQDRFKRKGVREQLEPLLGSSGISWGQYIHNKDEVTKQLVDEKKILTFSEKFKPRPYSYKVHDLANKLDKLDTENQIILIPAGAKLFRPGPVRSMLKKGATMQVRFHRKHPLDLKDSFKQSLQEVPETKFYNGWDFQGVNYSTQKFRIVLLYDQIRAQLALETFDDEDFQVKPYCSFMPERSKLIVKNIPSFETDVPYGSLLIDGVVLEEIAKENPARTFDLQTKGVGERGIYESLKFGRDFYDMNEKLVQAQRKGATGRLGYEEIIDHHVILAMHLAERDLATRKINIYNPFIKANEATINIFNKLHNNVLIDSYRKDGIKRSELDIPHMESLLWNQIGYENTDRVKERRAKERK